MEMADEKACDHAGCRCEQSFTDYLQLHLAGPPIHQASESEGLASFL
jgi:hypothetical protein